MFTKLGAIAWLCWRSPWPENSEETLQLPWAVRRRRNQDGCVQLPGGILRSMGGTRPWKLDPGSAGSADEPLTATLECSSDLPVTCGLGAGPQGAAALFGRRLVW